MMYNHLNPLAERTPLPIRLAAPCCARLKVPEDMESRTITIVAGHGRTLSLKLNSDSPHLLRFFEGNWRCEEGAKPQATIFALRREARAYGLPSTLDGWRWYSPQDRIVWMFGSEYYGNLKITVRGLCSELAGFNDMFIHGCAMAANDVGLLLMGASGAGKTTITAALRGSLGVPLRIVNDDWGVLNLESANASYTGESALHMKYRSVRAVTPEIDLHPSRFPSENFEGDCDDPHARLLITRESVFGETGVADRARIDRVVLLTRSSESKPSYRRLSPGDGPAIAAGAYSAFYRREEPFFNGSLFLTDPVQRDRWRREFEQLAETIPFYWVENGGDPSRVAELLMKLPA